MSIIKIFKIDVHLAAAMTDKQLLNFIKKKIKEEPNVNLHIVHIHFHLNVYINIFSFNY